MLLTGVEEVFPRGFHAFCSWHLGDNCRTNFKKQAQKEFEPLVYANTPDQFKGWLDRIKTKNAKLADYIQKIAPSKQCSRAFCPVRRWGHETSQQAESLNRALKSQRQEVAFKQSTLLWDYMMNKFYEKRAACSIGYHTISPKYHDYFEAYRGEGYPIQAKGRGPTVDSEDVNTSGSNVDDVQSRDSESESESPEEEFNDDAMAARKDAYVSGEDERRVEMDVSLSQSYQDLLPSQPGT
ncbi:unnamed protein product [Calypogeia fissa]